LLIDFNPRFYNQMAFDIARGFPAPLLAYHVATGGDSIHSIAPGASNLEPRGNKVFANRSTMQLMLWAHRLSGKRSSDEVEEWGRWYKTNRDRCVDAVYDHTDPFPAVFDFAGRFRRYLRHPRNFVYSLLER
jgi:hypothetical protein